MTTRVMLVESHTLLRKGLHSLIAGMRNYEVVGEASDGKDAVQQAVLFQPDLVLMELSLSGMNGFEATTQIKRRVPGARVIILTNHKKADFVREASRIGADAYILKDATFDELTTAMDSVISGKRFICKDVSLGSAVDSMDPAPAPRERTPWENLSVRERSVLKLIAEGKTNRAAAEFMCISAKTVEKHRAAVMRKLSLRNAAELVLTAIDMGVVQRESVMPTGRDRQAANSDTCDERVPYFSLRESYDEKFQHMRAS